MGLCPSGFAWNSSKERCPRGFLNWYENHLSLLLSAPSSSSSPSLSTLQISICSLPYPYDLMQNWGLSWSNHSSIQMYTFVPEDWQLWYCWIKIASLHFLKNETSPATPHTLLTRQSHDVRCLQAFSVSGQISPILGNESSPKSSHPSSCQ